MTALPQRLLQVIFALVLVNAIESSPASAAPFGSTAYTSFFIDGNFDYTDDFGEQIFSQTARDSAAFSVAAEARLDEASLGTTLKARGRLIGQGPDAYVNAFTSTLEQYTYVGVSPMALEYNFTLTGSVSTPVGATSEAFIYGDVDFFVASELDYYIEDIDQVPGLSETLGYEFAQIIGNVPNGSVDKSVSFVVDPGETFFMLSTMYAFAYSYDASADAFSTFSGAFTDVSQLQALSHTVPEPGTVLLAIVGMVSGSFRQRRC